MSRDPQFIRDVTPAMETAAAILFVIGVPGVLALLLWAVS